MTEEELARYTERKRAYQIAFNSIAGQEVMKDLSRFCAVKVTTGGDMLLEGRRQVFIRIQQLLELDVNLLAETYKNWGEY
jgi:hypothetical protein